MTREIIEVLELMLKCPYMAPDARRKGIALLNKLKLGAL
jgi:hypothetical protein